MKKWREARQNFLSCVFKCDAISALLWRRKKRSLINVTPDVVRRYLCWYQLMCISIGFFHHIYEPIYWRLSKNRFLMDAIKVINLLRKINIDRSKMFPFKNRMLKVCYLATVIAKYLLFLLITNPCCHWHFFYQRVDKAVKKSQKRDFLISKILSLWFENWFYFDCLRVSVRFLLSLWLLSQQSFNSSFVSSCL